MSNEMCKYCARPVYTEGICVDHASTKELIKDDPEFSQQVLDDIGWIKAHAYAICIGKELITTEVVDAKAVESYLVDFSDEQMANVVIIRYDKLIKGLKRKTS